MERTVGAILGLLMLVGCGVDAPPVPPGQENPETRRTIEEFGTITPESYF